MARFGRSFPIKEQQYSFLLNNSINATGIGALNFGNGTDNYTDSYSNDYGFLGSVFVINESETGHGPLALNGSANAILNQSRTGTKNLVFSGHGVAVTNLSDTGTKNITFGGSGHALVGISEGGTKNLVFSGNANTSIHVLTHGTKNITFGGNANTLIKISTTGTQNIVLHGNANTSIHLPILGTKGISFSGLGSASNLPYTYGTSNLNFGGIAQAILTTNASGSKSITFNGNASPVIHIPITATKALTFAGNAVPSINIPAHASGNLVFSGLLTFSVTQTNSGMGHCLFSGTAHPVINIPTSGIGHLSTAGNSHAIVDINTFGSDIFFFSGNCFIEFSQDETADQGISDDTDTVTIQASLLNYLNDRYVVPDLKDWELENERARYEQALYLIGEYSIFVLMWTLSDFEAGLVGRCMTCYTTLNPLVADTFKQPAYYKCPNCLGTSFEGGYKAILVRPSIWQWDEPTLNQAARGVTDNDAATVQTTSDFRMQPKDYIIRGNGTRWQVKGVEGIHIITGFGTAAGPWNAVSFTYREVSREDESSPIYMLPISEAILQAQMPEYYSRRPIDFSSFN